MVDELPVPSVYDEPDEEDDVVDEIDVYLAKNLAENLYLFQYLSRPAAVSYDKTACLSSRVKPKQQKVMLEMSLNTSGPSYCKSKGEQFAWEADHAASDDKKFFRSDRMDKQVLLSSQGTVSTSQYAVGLLRDGEIHLTPLKGVVQLRPSFEYLDRNQEKKPTNQEEGDSQDEDEEKATALLVRFAKKETEQAKAQRLSSYKHLEKQMSEEPWTEVEYFGINDTKSVEERNLLFCQEVNTEVLEFDATSSSYVEMLMPTTAEVSSDLNSLPTKFTTLAHVRKMDIIDQVRNRLIEAKLMTFSEISNALLPPANDVTVLKCLQQHAVLVQGSWVVKSELLYPKGKTSAFSSSTSETLCVARDYILYRFTESRIVQRSDVISVVKLTVNDVNDLLQQVATRIVNVGWEFKLPYDQDFVQKFGDVVKQQSSFWTTKYQTLSERYHLKNEVDNSDEVKVTKTNATTSRPPEVKCAVEPSPSISETQINQNACKELVVKDTETKLSPQDEEKLLNHLVKFVKDKLNTSSLSLAEFKKLLLLHHHSAGSQEDVLSSGVTDSLLLKAIAKCDGEEIDLKWPTTSQYPSDLNSRRIFVVRSLGSPLDKYRSVILNMFHGAFSVQRRMIMEKSRQVLGTAPTASEYNKVIQELGLERKGACWFIRGTQPGTLRT
ncbi:DNA-directed RNA polymerase III subunit RPC5-like isoform X1 [Dendronephthya gigantea]|uniref:DNA-directed RNA polymerase III subunit RPC5-like isoform X1 n=2 Tax=Dendronephthya gigantea TaxID=151771 RepID=UPI00106D5072|nr:DNA-directed RNA polymerase III subunit RPC5-like isoform X1 [Dendronephthya gigantea]